MLRNYFMLCYASGYTLDYITPDYQYELSIMNHKKLYPMMRSPLRSSGHFGPVQKVTIIVVTSTFLCLSELFLSILLMCLVIQFIKLSLFHASVSPLAGTVSIFWIAKKWFHALLCIRVNIGLYYA